MGHMSSRELLDISGKPLVMLGGEYTVLRHVSKGIVTEYTWHDGEPCMLLFKDGRHGKQGVYRIQLSEAFLYANNDGNPSTSLMSDAREAAAAMGFDRNDKNAVFKVMTTILECLPDLIKMPPPPAELERRESVGHGNNELLFKLDGKTLFEGLV